MQRFIDYFLIIGIDEEKQKGTLIDGKILCKIPEQDWEESQFIDGNLSLFCQPLGWILTIKPKEPSYFVSVLTDIKGNRYYCACLSFSESISVKSLRQYDDEDIDYDHLIYQNHNVMYAPKCLVLVSKFNYVDIFKNCLSIIYTVYAEELNVSLETVISNLLACVEVPLPGENELEFSLGASDNQYLQSPLDPLVPCTGTIVHQLFEQLGIHTVMTLFIAIMTEHKVLMHSQSFSRLYNACEALISLIYPFKYSHAYIPILPSSLTEVLNIPTPFLIGCHSDLKCDFEDSLIETIIVDLDCGRLFVPDVNLPSLDKITYNELINQLCLVIKPQSVHADNAFTTTLTTQSPPHILDKEIRSIFLRFIAQVLQGYRNFLQIVRIFPKPFITFHKTLFLGTRNLVENEFMVKLLDSMFFNSFIQERGLPYRYVDLFDVLFASLNDILREEARNPSLFLKNIRNLAEKLLVNEFSSNTNNPNVKLLTPSKEAIEKSSLRKFPSLNTKVILEKIENETIKKEMTQTLITKKFLKKELVPFGASIACISNLNESNMITNSARRLEVMKNCVNCIFENKITDARKTFPAVLKALENKFARLALAQELSLHITDNGNKAAVLEHEQFDLIVKLMNCALQQDCDYVSESTSSLCVSELGDVNGLAAAILPLSMTFCRRLNTGVIQFAYSCLQEHSIWSKMSFWESCFYLDSEKDLIALYGLSKNECTEDNYHQLALNVAAQQIKLAETLSEKEIQLKSANEESTVYSQAIHYSNKIVYLKIPLDIGNTEKNFRNNKHINNTNDGQGDSNSYLTGTIIGRESFHDRDGCDNESGYEEGYHGRVGLDSNSEKGLAVIKYIDRFIEKIALEASISEDHVKSLHALVPSVVALQCETLDTVYKESKKLPPITKSKIIVPYLLPGEEITAPALRSFLIVDGREEVIGSNYTDNISHSGISDTFSGPMFLPAEGALFLTNYRIIFRGKPWDPLACESVIVRSFPISTLSKEKRISISTHNTPTIDQYLHEGLQLKSNIFQVIKIAFDNEVTTDLIEIFRKMINKARYPSNVFHFFAFTSQQNASNQIKLLNLQNKKDKSGTLRGFAKKTLLRTAEKTGLNVNRGKKFKEKYFNTLSGSKTMLYNKNPMILESTNDDKSLNDDISIKSDSSHHYSNSTSSIQNDSVMLPPLYKERDFRTLRKLIELSYVKDYQRLQIGSTRNLLYSHSGGSIVLSPTKIQQQCKDFRISIVNINYNVTHTYPAFIIVPSNISDESIKKLSKCYKSQRFPAIIWKHPKKKSLLLRSSEFHGKGVIGLFKSHGPTTNMPSNLSNISSNNQHDSSAYEQEKYFKSIVNLTPISSDINSSYSNSINSLELSSLSDLSSKDSKKQNVSSFQRALNSLRTSGGKSSLGTISHSMGKQLQKWNNRLNNDNDISSINSTVTSLSQSSNFLRVSGGLNGADSLTSNITTSKIENKTGCFYIFGEKIQFKNLKVDHFPSSCTFVPIDIHETKHVKQSFKKLMRICCPTSVKKSDPECGFFYQIEQCEWMKQVQKIISIANDIVDVIDYKGCSAMLCLEESIDIVPQIVSIAELCLDPYYRTFNGFRVLIEKEWLAFGHKFSYRSNQTAPIMASNYAPLFLQFLDIVHQIMKQFPLSFEFNQYYLKFIAYHYVSCRFRTFMLDNERERAEFGWIYEDLKKFDDDSDFISTKDNLKLDNQNTSSVYTSKIDSFSNAGINYIGSSFWDYLEKLWNKNGIFFNFYYVAASYLNENDEKNICVLRPSTNLTNFQVWDYYLTEELSHGPSFDFEMVAFEKQRREEVEATGADNSKKKVKRVIINPIYDSISHFQANGIEEMLDQIKILETELGICEQHTWYQIWDKIEIPMLSTANLSLNAKDLKLSISSQILRRYNISTQAMNNYMMNSQKLHRFEKFNFATPVVCDNCKFVLWDLVKTGMKCKDCGYNIHERCYENVKKFKCYGKELRNYINYNIKKDDEDEKMSIIERNEENEEDEEDEEEEEEDEDEGESEENDLERNDLHRSNTTYYKQFMSLNTLAENQTYAGYLFKKGVLLKGWKQSWYVLDSIKHQLRYYESKEINFVKGYIDLAEVVSVNSQNESNSFELKTIRRNYSFMAPDNNSAQEWIEKIQACLQ